MSQGLTRVLSRLDRGLLATERAILAAGILGIAGVSIVNVLARNLAGGSLPFAEEVSQALMLWVTFAGAGLAARRARHIRMSALYERLRGGARKLAWMGISAGTASLLLVLAVLAVRYVLRTHEVGGVTPALRVPLSLVYLVVPLGLGITALEYALTFLRNLLSDGVHASFDLAEGVEEDTG